MSSIYKGKCLCGTTTYVSTGAPINPHLCSCTMCQRSSGAPTVAWLAFNLKDFSWGSDSELGLYRSSETTQRCFCKRCGSFMGALNDGCTSISITIASLENPNLVIPGPHHSYEESAPSWWKTTLLRDISHKAPSPTQKISVRPSVHEDIQAMVRLSKEKRLSYEKVQPTFWRYAGPKAEVAQTTWFETLLTRDDIIMLTATDENHTIVGFIIGQLTKAPDVYDPLGLTLLVDDFCVAHEHDWDSIGGKFLQTIKDLAREKGATQAVIVCGAHDIPKRNVLHSNGFNVTSEWFVKNF